MWTVDNGWLVFGPRKGFYGTTNPVTYTVLDENGELRQRRPPRSRSRPRSMLPHRTHRRRCTPTETITINPLINDIPSPGATWDAGSLMLIDPATNLPVKTLILAGVGTFTANPDGTIVFAGRWLQGRNAENRLRGDR